MRNVQQFLHNTILPRGLCTKEGFIFFPFSGEVLPLQRHECKSNSLNFLLFLPSGISKLFKSKYNPKCCWHTSQVWNLFVKTKAREARKHETFVGRQKATSIIKNGWKHYLLFSVSELELMRKIRVRGGGGGGLIVQGNGEETWLWCLETLLPWRSVGRQLEMCRSCLNGVCIID